MRRTRVWFRVAALLVLLVICCQPASAAPAWQVVLLHPSSELETSALGVSGASAVGYVRDFSGVARPALWANSSLPITLPGPADTWALGIDGTTIVGQARVTVDAVVWQGEMHNLAVLEPSGVSSSSALAVFGATEVGSMVIGGAPHAAAWAGSAETVRDIHPVVAWGSALRAIDATGEAGDLIPVVHGSTHAALWQGTAESVVDLHPEGAYSSGARAIANGRQGGYVQYERDGPAHAALWSGTPDSYVDLTPSFVWTAGINGMDGGVQAGVGVPTGSSGFHALVWFGSADSCLDLHSFLSSDYTKSEARAVDIDEFGTIRVVGYAYNENYYLPNGTYYPRNEAMMWVLVPEPSSLAALAAGLAGLAGVRPRRRR